MNEPSKKPIELHAADGLKLTGYHFANENPRAAILVCSATAVTQRFYFPFARWLSIQGYSVLTLDYRGIGESLGAPSVKESRARKQDWGELDMPAALSWLQQTYPNKPKHLIGHSAGGLLFGLMPNYRDLASVVSIGCSIGYVNEAAMPDRLVASALLNVYFPVATKLFGYLPAKTLGWGEDLPPGVALQWAEWCTNRGYVSNAFGKDIKKHYYNDLQLPMLVMNMKDDPFATVSNVDAMNELFPNATMEKLWLDPKQYGLETVGHMGFFRPKNDVLWPKVTEWLQNH